MANKMVHLRVPGNLYADSREIVEDSGFGSIQEFIKESMRKMVYEYKKQVALMHLRQLKGSLKPSRRLSTEERNVLAREFVKQSRSERLKLLREFGLDKVRKA